jgi:hypothetical protein
MSKMQGGLLLILVKQFFFIPLFILKISKICLKFESKINYLWKQLKCEDQERPGGRWMTAPQ